MSLLFSYGTLQIDAVQLATFGRLLDGASDELIGFEESWLQVDDPVVVAISGKSRHVIVRFNGRNDCRVRGRAFEVTEEELAKADRYEPVGYTRISAVLASGKTAGCMLMRGDILDESPFRCPVSPLSLLQ